MANDLIILNVDSCIKLLYLQVLATETIKRYTYWPLICKFCSVSPSPPKFVQGDPKGPWKSLFHFFLQSSRNMTRRTLLPLGDQRRKWQQKPQLCGSTFSDPGKDCISSSPRPFRGPQERGCTLRMGMHKNTFTNILGWWLQRTKSWRGENPGPWVLYSQPPSLFQLSCLFTLFFQASAPSPPPPFSSLSCGGAPPESNVHKAHLLSCTTSCLKGQPQLKGMTWPLGSSLSAKPCKPAFSASLTHPQANSSAFTEWTLLFSCYLVNCPSHFPLCSAPRKLRPQGKVKAW